MKYTKVGNITLDILISDQDQDKGTFFLGCGKCHKATKDWGEFFNHIFLELDVEMKTFLDKILQEKIKNGKL